MRVLNKLSYIYKADKEGNVRYHRVGLNGKDDVGSIIVWADDLNKNLHIAQNVAAKMNSAAEQAVRETQRQIRYALGFDFRGDIR